MKMKSFPRTAILAIATVSLAACVTTPPEPEAPAVALRTPAQMLGAVHKAAQGGDERELNVQPLRDPEVEDLRDTAGKALAAGDAAAAAAALDKALGIVADDPAVLQERAEVALAQGEFDRAEQFAARATALGSAVGPLCRRHWETVRQVRERRREQVAAPLKRPNQAQLDEQAAKLVALDRAIGEAGQQFDACTVPGINRM